MTLPAIEFDETQTNEQDEDRFFDPWRIPRSEGTKTLICKIIGNVQVYEEYYNLRQRKRRRKDQETHEATVSAVMCDLMHAVLMQDQRGIAIPRSNQVLGRGDRYQAPAENRQLPYVLDALGSNALEWLVEERGYINHFGRNQRTLIKPTQRLVDNMKEFEVELRGLGRCKTEEVIILKAEKEDYWDKGAYLPYDDTALTNRYREEMRIINSWLAGASIEFDEAALERDRPIDTGNLTLRRYFSQGSFESGGRLFGGFWQGLSEEERLEGLIINGENVVGLDYGQMAPRILYGLAKAQPPEGDLYDIPGLTTVNGRSYREGVKKVMNALMFSDGLPKRKPMETKSILPPDLSIQEVVDLILQAHPAIAHLLGTEVGHKAQFIESQVMVKVLLRLREQSIVALPIHDGLVIPSEAEAKAVMIDTFKDEVGVDCPVSVELSKDRHPLFNINGLLQVG
ncbi:hypothetical protein AA309_22565 [Microvirga vignae]|uniref:DNA-directed DNA polymerase family A palm domain-containing protein n=1 Tax=Microvirga vignae TaxID=1225564 RepID=A0A0H1REF2_9HYPH|nr:hypothetical protein [Microvirga vignae]KLK90972.1 hypothetical protein AA309_22565 [Microvirga vignae]